MSETNLYRVQHLRGTTSEWQERGHIIPGAGEIVVEIDEQNHLHKLKIGDGEHSYQELAYLMARDEVVAQVLPRVINIDLPAEGWKDLEEDEMYYQEISNDTITPYSRLDLHPTLKQLQSFKLHKLTFSTENHNTQTANNQTIKICVKGSKPTENYNIQATIVETNINSDQVAVGTPIIGTPIITSVNNVYIGADQPTNDNVELWLDTDELVDIDALKGPQGDKGDPFTFDDFTEEQLALLKGENRNKILDYITYTIENNCVSITGCDTSISGSHIIPNTIEGYPVTTIGMNAFENCTGITSMIIPKGITSLQPDAFYGCSNLTSIEIPDTVNDMGYDVFSGCTKLKEVSFNAKITSLYGSTFANCTSLTSIVIPNGVIDIIATDFYNCSSLKTITIPDSVIYIGSGAFENCTSLTDIYYSGTQEQWDSIDIYGGNDSLLNATIHYNQELATKEYVDDKISPLKEILKAEYLGMIKELQDRISVLESKNEEG